MADVRRRPGRGMLAATVVAFAILISLGTWQVYRLQWKEALIAGIEARRHAAPLPIAELARQAAAGRDVDYVPVTLSGVFDNAHEQYFFATDDGKVGYYVYTPLDLADGRTVFVNRGFVPEDLRDPARRAEGQPAGAVTVTGLARARLSGKPSWVVPGNEPGKSLYFWKDLDAMAANAAVPSERLVPFFVDADATPNPGGWPKGGVTQIDLPNNHLNYALTWYGLAAALVVISVLAFRRKATDRAGSRKRSGR